MGSYPIMARAPALFLDRDGIINVEKNYVHRVDDFEFVDGIFELCRVASLIEMKLVVVTNQAGIGRGYYSEEQFHILMNWVRGEFAKQSIVLDAVYFCPYHPEHGIGLYKQDSFERKPKPGMLLRARDELGLDMAASVMIGDRMSDIAAAKAAGVGTALLLGRSTEAAHNGFRCISCLNEATLMLHKRVPPVSQ